MLWREGMSRRAFLARFGRLGVGVLGVGAVASFVEACSGGSSGTSAPPATASAVPSRAAATPAASLTAASVKVQLLWVEDVEFAGLYAAQSQGYFKDEALTQTLIPGGPQINAIQAVAAGTAPIGLIGSTDQVIEARANGIPIKAIGTLFQKSPSGVMSLASAPIKTAADLVGKKIGLQAGGRTTFGEMLAANNINSDQVTTVAVGLDPTPLVTKQVDGFWSYAFNQPLELEAKGIKTAMLLASDAGVPTYGDVIFTLDSVLQQQEQLLVRWLRAVVRGWEYAIAHTTEMAKFTVDQSPSLKLDLTQQTAQSAAQVSFVTSALTKSKGLLWIDPTSISKSIDLVVKTGLIKAPVKLDDVMTTSILEKAYGGKTSL